MRYVTTNIRLPEDLWKDLKIEAAENKKRLAEIIRARLKLSGGMDKKHRKQKSLAGLWKGLDIPDSAIEEAKKSLFPDPIKFLK